MRRCFVLARKGLGMTRTNPLVGSVIVHENSIIGEGYHHEFGGPHAEVNAIRSVKNQSLLPDSTLYCSLEPCAHHGKTPPCANLIKQKGLSRVVISNSDPFKSVNGEGIRFMREAGITVETDCLAEEGYNLNRRFIGFIKHKRPYIILKWAQTTDGYIDLEREPGDSEGPRWITDDVNRTLVHKWRSEEAAIMVGTNTVITDNPGLNVRRWTGENPIRVTMDRKGRLSNSSQIFDGKQETIIFSGIQRKYAGRTRSIHADLSYELGDVLEELYDQKIISVFVEGGAKLLASFFESGLWDEARVFTGKMAFSQGVKAPEMNNSPAETLYINDAKLEIFKNNSVN